MLDVSQNPNLQILSCWGNLLSVLDVSGNFRLRYLYCSSNLLSVLDVSQNPNLRYLDCSYNILETLDNVLGWNQIGLVLGRGFVFYPQNLNYWVVIFDANGGLIAGQSQKTLELPKTGAHLPIQDNPVNLCFRFAGWFDEKGVEWRAGYIVTADLTLYAQWDTDLVEHVWGEGVVTIVAACEVDGELTSACSVCGTTKTDVILAIDHDWSEKVIDPTCTERGYTIHICANDEEHNFVDNYVSELGHNWGEFDYSQGRVLFADPVSTCERCDGTDYVYNWSITETDPTCTTDGYTQYSRSDGWRGWVYDEGSALGHLWGEFDYSQGRVLFADPVSTCERCKWSGYVYSWIITVVAPTCTADGYTQYSRSDGWTGWIYDEGSTIGHDFIVTDLGWGIEYRCGRCSFATYTYADETYVATSKIETPLNVSVVEQTKPTLDPYE